jgi:large subunit ribosomal protein L4
MAELSVVGGGQVSFDSRLFSEPFNSALVHQIVVAYQANGRLGTRKQKTRSEIAKSTRKPWRQKGTGRARAGMASSPIWRGGGRAFPSSPFENFSQKMNRKMYSGAMKSIVSKLFEEKRVSVVQKDFFEISEAKTKLALAKLKSAGLDGKFVLFVLDSETFNEEFCLAARNIYNVAFIGVRDLNPVVLMFFDLLVCSENALREMEELFDV